MRDTLNNLPTQESMRPRHNRRFRHGRAVDTRDDAARRLRDRTMSAFTRRTITED
jgi:hypothetical protein